VNAVFEEHRPFLRGLAYRLLGTVSDIEDVLQDAWLRWHGVAADVEHPRRFLARIVTNLCLDRLKSAQAQRECYVGEWLPEPLVVASDYVAAGPEALSEYASDLSFAFMRTLEVLSPPERAAFLLHDVFDVDFATIAQALNLSEANCRQLAVRARNHVRDQRPRFPIRADAALRLQQAFSNAIQNADPAPLAATLAEDVTFYSDGGGKVAAVPRPLHGAAKVAQVLLGFAKGYDLATTRIDRAEVNGLPGFIVREINGRLIQTIALEPNEDGRIQAIYVQRNPDKLRHIQPARSGDTQQR
jgi:RNA polymerase sigma-70 factor, ECF subfamily